MRIGLVALSLAGGAAACGHLPPCPAAGGPAWTEIQSAHFRLRTDEDAASARATVTDLEQFWTGMLFVFGAPAGLDTGRLPVVVVDRGWTDFAPPEIAGYFTHALFQPLAVMVSSGRVFTQVVIKHELFHYMSRLVMPHQPPWLSEGLATFYETIEYQPDRGRFIVGSPSPTRLRDAYRLPATAMESIFAAKALDPGDLDRFYAAAWITTHYLMNRRPEALTAYEKALRAGATQEAAWTAAFGAETPAQVAAEVRNYLHDGRYTTLIVRFAPPPLGDLPERPLSDADAHATRALLYATGVLTRPIARGFSQKDDDDAKMAARREVAEALRQEPENVAARAVASFMLNAPIDLELATTATQKSAGDWLAWILLAAARGERGDTAGWNDAVDRARPLMDPSVEVHATVVHKK